MNASRDVNVDENNLPKVIPFSRKRLQTISFHRFFALGLDECVSPFLNLQAKKISKNFQLKISIAAAIAWGVGFLLHLFDYLPPLDQLALFFSFLVVGTPALIDAIEELFQEHRFSIDTLMTIAAFGSLAIGQGFSGALLLVLFALSGAIEDAVTARAKRSLFSLEELQPVKALVEDGELIVEIALPDVKIDSIIRVPHGEVIPLDGEVVGGEGAISLAHLTGESYPQWVQRGSKVPAGARLVEGSLRVKVERLSKDSTITKLIQLITKAHEVKPTLSKKFEAFGTLYSTAIFSIALGIIVLFPLLIGIPFFGDSGSILRGLSFLITSSPCALVLAVPIAYVSALGAAASRGVIVKGSVLFDALHDSQAVAFDKTGTLTYGRLRLVTPISDEQLMLLAAVEQGSNHPIALAILQEATKRKLPLLSVKSFRSIPGAGVDGVVLFKQPLLGSDTGGQKTSSMCRVFIGRPSYFLKEGVEMGVPERDPQAAEIARLVEMHAKQGLNCALALIDGRPLVLAFQDEIRKESFGLVERLKKMKKALYILSGDHKEAVASVANQLQIEHFTAEMKPEDKLQEIERLSRHSGLVMVGDGINDAPALARATVGISMGTVGSATARDAADIVLLHDGIEYVDWLINKAYAVRKIAVQNLVLALIVILFSAIPAACGLIPLWLAVILHEGGTVCVGLNGLRLLK